MEKKLFYTSFFDNIKNLSDDEYFFVCIRGDHPDWFDGFIYRPFIPRKWWFDWEILPKNTTQEYYNADWFYRDHYRETNLSKLTPQQVISDLENLAATRKIVFVCGEIPPEFCHRRIIDEWLSEAGCLVEELDFNREDT